MRIDKTNYPVLEWVKNKYISSDIDFNPLNISDNQKKDARVIIKQILNADNFKCEYATDPIIKIIDYNDKNIHSFMKMREEDHGGSGLFMYNNGVPISILYSIKTGLGDWKISQPGIIGDDVKKAIIVYSFYKKILLRSFVAFLKGTDGKKETYQCFSGLCHALPQDPDGHTADHFQLVDDFMIFKKYAELQTKVLPPKSGVDFLNCKYVNDTNKQVTLYNSIYFTALIQSGCFNVKGHFRLQPCGEGMKQKKLIWINDFKKDGYTRLAGKLAQ